MSNLEEHEEAYKQNPAPHDYVTVAGHCIAKKVKLTKGELCQVGKLACKKYVELSGGMPKKAPEMIGDDIVSYVNAYEADALFMIDEAIEEILFRRDQKKKKAAATKAANEEKMARRHASQVGRPIDWKEAYARAARGVFDYVGIWVRSADGTSWHVCVNSTSVQPGDTVQTTSRDGRKEVKVVATVQARSHVQSVVVVM